MAQGKLKVKAKVPGKSGKKNTANHQQKSTLNKVKKGNKIIAPKKQAQQQLAKYKKGIQKAINQNIEAEVSAKAQKFEEGKKFWVVGNPSSDSKGKNKKK